MKMSSGSSTEEEVGKKKTNRRTTVAGGELSSAKPKVSQIRRSVEALESV